MKKLTLVNSTKGYSTGVIPLGLASIATYLKKYGDLIDVTILDANCQNIYLDYQASDIVGITAVSNDIKYAIEYAYFVKSKSNIPIVLGGVHITTLQELPEPFDIGVIGEGEETMLELVSCDDLSKASLIKIKGICFRDKGKTIITEPRPLISPLDKIPIPDRDYMNMEYYLKKRLIIPYHPGRTLTLMSSRGCPYNCVFCSTRVHWHKYRAFSAQRVIEEIELIINKYNVEYIHIFDDLFIADKKRFSDIHKMIIDKKINEKVKFMCLVRSDMLDDATMIQLKEMNIVVMGIGMESGCPHILNYLKKGTTTIEQNRLAIDLANKYNLPTMGSFMLGNPGETEQDLLQTLEFIKSYRYSPYLAPLCYIATAFPGTEFWKYGKAKGVKVDDFDNITMDLPVKLECLKNAPLLTDIPIERFFKIVQLFRKEESYGAIKRFVFFPKNIFSPLYVLFKLMWIEKNPFTGMIETIKYYYYLKLKLSSNK